MNIEKRQKYFVNHKETVAIRCNACGRVGVFSVASLSGKKHSIRVTCPCSETFRADLEFRQDYRIRSAIPASFRALSTPRGRARSCVVADHSTGGILLETDLPAPIKQDDRLIVRYRPEGDADHEIERIIRVRHHDQGRRIGGAFVDEPLRRSIRQLGTAFH
jgi:hypothetical protein